MSSYIGLFNEEKGDFTQLFLRTFAIPGYILECEDVLGAAKWSPISSLAVSSIEGTANQVLVNGTSGAATTGIITLTLPQSIGTTSNVQFGNVTANLYGQVMAATQSSITSIPNLATIGTVTSGVWNGTAINGSYINYNTTNLKVTSSRLNTIQDIATASSPTFAGLTIGSSLISSTIAAYLAVINQPLATTSSPTFVSVNSNFTGNYSLAPGDSLFFNYRDTGLPDSLNFNFIATGDRSNFKLQYQLYPGPSTQDFMKWNNYSFFLNNAVVVTDTMTVGSTAYYDPTNPGAVKLYGFYQNSLKSYFANEVIINSGGLDVNAGNVNIDTGYLAVTAGLIYCPSGININGSLIGPTQATYLATVNQYLATSSNVQFNNILGTLTTAAQPNITSVGTLTSLTMGGTLSLAQNQLNLFSAANNDYYIKFDNSFSGNLHRGFAGHRFAVGSAGSTISMIINGSANTTLASSDLASTTYRLYVDGQTRVRRTTGGGYGLTVVNTSTTQPLSIGIGLNELIDSNYGIASASGEYFTDSVQYDTCVRAYSDAGASKRNLLLGCSTGNSRIKINKDYTNFSGSDANTRLTYINLYNDGYNNTTREYQAQILGVSNSASAYNSEIQFYVHRNQASVNLDLAFGARGIPGGAQVVMCRDTIPNADNSWTLGANGSRWVNVWAVNGTIQTSDQNQKQDITDTDLGLEFLLQLRPVSYRWKPATSESRMPDRKHYGLIAQEVKSVLDDFKIETKDAGFYIESEEYDANEIKLRDPSITYEEKEPLMKKSYGLRYEELICPLIKGIQQLVATCAALEQRIISLESPP